MRWLPIGLVLVAAALGWPLSASALAGTYTWQLPTSSAPGSSNPDHDSYGATAWTYVEAANASSAGPPPLVPSSFQPLATFSSSIDGGLTGWQDAADGDRPFVAVNRNGGAVTGSFGLQIPSGQLALQPAGDRVVGIGWTSPLSSPQSVTVSGTFQPDNQNASCPGSQPSWVVEQDGLILASEPPGGTAGAGSQQPFSTTTTVNPGDTVYFVLGWYGVPTGFSPACTTAGLTLSLQAPSTPPTVTLSTPSGGRTVAGAQPTFSGSASNGFGDAGTVTVRVWRGSSASGTPLEVLSPNVVNGTYSAGPNPPLGNGTYTAQAEQDDLAGDAARSAPTTFSVHNVAPKVTLAPVASGPVTTATQTLKGTAGTAPGDASSVLVAIWSGVSAKGMPVRTFSTTRGAAGRWSIRVKPGLPNGRYTAIAVQEGPGSVYGASRAQLFTIRVHPPPVIAGAPSLDRAGEAAIQITCTASAGSCSGDVLVLTKQVMRPLPDGPQGHARVLFSYVHISAGQTATVLRPLPSYVAAALRRDAPVEVTVTVKLRDSAGHAILASGVALLRLIR